MKSLLFAVLLTFSAQAYSSDDCRYDCDPPPDDPNIDIDINTQGGAGGHGGEGGDGYGGEGGDGYGGEATGGNVSLNQTYDSRRVPPIFLYQANQVEACGRVFGFSGANTSGGWAFGIPIPRSWTPTCDLWKAANEAQENDFIWLSYTFQCSIKTVRKTMGEDLCVSMELAAENEMMVLMGFEAPHANLLLPDLGGLYNQAAQSSGHYEYDEHEGHLMADITQEEYEEQQQVIADKFAQYENKIDSQEAELTSVREEQQRRIADKEAEQKARIEVRERVVMDLSNLKSTAQQVEEMAQEEEPEDD